MLCNDLDLLVSTAHDSEMSENPIALAVGIRTYQLSYTEFYEMGHEMTSFNFQWLLSWCQLASA